MASVIILSSGTIGRRGLSESNMRVSKEQAAENRSKILHAAAKLIRERGIAGVGVDALTEAAGLTHGSVYSRFGSKDSLAAEAVQLALQETASKPTQAADLKTYVSGYLSARHRDAPGKGCALAALGAEIPRSSVAVRSNFTAGLRRMVESVSNLIGSGSKRRRTDEAIATVAAMVGALVLARAVDDPELSDRILAACRHSLSSSKNH
jgi:TetR/AcrR family transcriptional repressor of nem operon